MTVQHYVALGLGVVTDNVYCIWFDGVKKYDGEFHEDTLKVYTPKKPLGMSMG